MAQDIREMLKNDKKLSSGKMPVGHEERFLLKLDKSKSKSPSQSTFFLMKIAAGLVIIFGLGYGAMNFLKQNAPDKTIIEKDDIAELKTLGDVSPGLKKVEDYYIANINLELSNMDINDDNKELFDGYIAKLEVLNEEYKRLSEELTDSGPDELTVGALIDNLKFRLNLLYRLKEQLNELNQNNSKTNRV